MYGFKSSRRIWLAVTLMLIGVASMASGQIPSITSNGSLGAISWIDGSYTFNTDTRTIDSVDVIGSACPPGTYTGPGDLDGCARLVSQPSGLDIVVYDLTTFTIGPAVTVYVTGSRPAAIAATGVIGIGGC
jgi:hypothetical protein